MQANTLFANEHCSLTSTKEPFHITLFQPIQERSELWRASHQFAKAVASDLNVTLEIVSIDDDTRDRFAFKKLTLDTLEGQQGRDFVISLLYGGGEYEQLEIFNRIGIPFITFNSSLGPKLLKRTGQPRQQFKHWIAHVSPDEFDAGAKLVADLINHKKVKPLRFLAVPPIQWSIGIEFKGDSNKQN